MLSMEITNLKFNVKLMVVAKFCMPSLLYFVAMVTTYLNCSDCVNDYACVVVIIVFN